ncbi:MAG: addiction module toxin, HicA family [Nitrospirae bacterium]|nr:addiction module toxin, HicA family [Nitrospirota bacterium]
MPRPITLKMVLRVLKSQGFELISQKGSHAKYRKTGNQIRVCLPLQYLNSRQLRSAQKFQTCAAARRNVCVGFCGDVYAF